MLKKYIYLRKKTIYLPMSMYNRHNIIFPRSLYSMLYIGLIDDSKAR